MSGWESSSDTTTAIVPAFVAALCAMEDVVKDRKADIDTKAGGKIRYSYADLGSALDKARPVLKANGLAVSQPPINDGHDVAVTTIVMHSSGEWLAFPPVTIPAGPSAQNKGSAITYARRYSLMAILGMATEDDDGAGAGVRQAATNTVNAPTFSKEAHDMLAELRGHAGTPIAEAVKGYALSKQKGLSLAELDDAAWRFELGNVIDEAKNAAAVGGVENPGAPE
jgi:hypothetical protein